MPRRRTPAEAAARQARIKSRSRKQIIATRRARPNEKGDPVPEIYSGIPAVLLATGPSLSEEQIEYIRPLHEQKSIAVFGLNDAYKWCDFLDVFYFCDPRWLDCNPDAADYGHGQIWTQDAGVGKKYANINRVKGGSGKGLCRVASEIHFGGNSGFQLLNLAWHFGIRKFYLLGYNMDVPKGMKQHMFGPHPKGLNQSNSYKNFVNSYNQITPADKALITNCTYPTALTGFKQQPLEEALPHDPKRYVRERVDASKVDRRPEPSEETTGNATDLPVDTPEVQGEHRCPYCDRTFSDAEPTGDGEAFTYGG